MKREDLETLVIFAKQYKEYDCEVIGGVTEEPEYWVLGKLHRICFFQVNAGNQIFIP